MRTVILFSVIASSVLLSPWEVKQSLVDDYGQLVGLLLVFTSFLDMFRPEVVVKVKHKRG